MAALIDFVMLIGLLIIAWILLIVATHRLRLKAEAQCAECRHDLCVDPGLTCPVCGYTHASERERMHGKVKKKTLAVGLVAAALQLMVWGGCVTQGVLNWRAANKAVEVSMETHGVLETDTTYFNTVNTARYTRPTLWLAEAAGLPTTSRELDRLDPNWNDLRGNGVYLSRWFLSPLRHMGNHMTFIAPRFYRVDEKGPDVSPDVLEKALGKVAPCEGIEQIVLPERCRVDDACAAQLGKIEGLRRMTIMQADISDQGMAVFAPLRELNEVRLETNRPVTDTYLKAFSGSALTSLSLDGKTSGKITPGGAEALRGKVPRFLTLRVPYWVEDHPRPFDSLTGVGEVLEMVLPDVDEQRLGQLAAIAPSYGFTLDLSGNPRLAEEGLDALGVMPQMPTTLRIKGNGRLKAAPLNTILKKYATKDGRGSYSHSMLELWDFDLDASFFDAMGESDVSSLGLVGCRTGGPLWDHMSENKRLAYIYLRDMPLTREDVQALGRVRMLEYLWLEGVKLTQEQLREVAMMPRLKSLSVDEVDDAMLLALKDCPWLAINAARDVTTPVGQASWSGVKIEKRKVGNQNWLCQ